MEQSLHWAGVDTSTRTFAVCVVDEQGNIIREAQLPADITDMHQFLSAASPISEVAFETGTTSIHPARALQALGYNVTVYHALSVQRFVRLMINKTDVNDARGLAELARLRGGQLRKVYLRPRHLSVLRMKLVTRERLMQMRKVNEAALMSLLHAHGVRADERVSSETSLRRVVEKLIAKAEVTYGASVREMTVPLLELSATLRAEELRIENDLKKYASMDDLCQRLIAIPGVGLISAISFITAVGDPSRFSRSGDVGAYLGLTPKIWKTGAFERKRGISKKGSGLTRRHLHMASRAALRSHVESSMQRWAKHLAARSNRKIAVVALARKLAVVMLAMWKNGTSFELERLAPLRENGGLAAD